MSVVVMSVTGPVSSAELGITLTHEHIINDVTSWSQLSGSRGWEPQDFAQRPVTEDILWDLKHDPFGNLDNCCLNDQTLAVSEVARFASLGGTTIMDATSMGIGRDLATLHQVSTETGVTILAGTGFYLEASQPEEIKGQPPEAIAEVILGDLAEGCPVGDGTTARPGFIGEIGVGEPFTANEEASLRGAFLAQMQVGLPIQVHLPGWFRTGDRVLDIAEEYGVDPGHIVLCHMGPSGSDREYQHRLLHRGAVLQYDMIGMEVFYADQGVQCPSDEENATWIAALIEAGFGDQLLLSQDVFLKSLLRCHGGPGYGHILQYFVPRLERHGLSRSAIDRLLIDNPRKLFEK